MTDTQQPEIEFLILADRAEIHNGKLCMMGGAFDRLVVQDFRLAVSLSIALAVLVPWTRAGQDLAVEIHVESEDGKPVPPAIAAHVNAQPMPDAPYGRPLRCVVAGGGAWTLPGPGVYRIVATVEGGSTKAVLLHAAAPGPTAMYRTAKIPTSCQA